VDEVFYWKAAVKSVSFFFLIFSSLHFIFLGISTRVGMLEYADIILYYSSIVKLTMLGRRASELALRGLRGSQYGLLQ